MGEWLRDFLGINKYAVHWDFETWGVRLQSSESYRFLGGGMSKRHARRMAENMNRVYGAGSHWIERADIPTGRRSLSEQGEAE